MGISIVTGANRGIGLALAQGLHARGAEVLAACRKSSPALDALAKASNGKVRVAPGIDVADADAGKKLLAALGTAKLDLVIHNAGILAADGLAETNEEELVRCFRVNAAAPLLLTRALVDRLEKGAKVGIVTSRMGSIDDNGSGGYYAYRMSKAAVNMAGKSLAVDLRGRGVAVALLHPGYVKTDMNHGGGAIDATTSAEGMLAVLAKLDLAASGSFFNYTGAAIPW